MDLQKIGFYTLNNQRALIAAKATKDGPPLRIQRLEIIINETCNFKCPYCKGLAKDVFGQRTKRELSYDEVTTYLTELCKPEPVRCIRFSGGEPTLHKRLADMVKFAKNLGVEKIAVSTNGFSNLTRYCELIAAGVNDFSISLDAPDAQLGDQMSGVKNSWVRVVGNIKALAKITYVTVGVVFTPDNIGRFIDTVTLADKLGVADIRVIPSAQWNGELLELSDLPQEILDRHPILQYRASNFGGNRRVRGLSESDCHQCHLVKDDAVIAGQYHYPCVIYMREQGSPIGKVGPNMRAERWEWFSNHDSHRDRICRVNCLDVCVEYNNEVEKCCNFQLV
jgi:molybdenum cofactor biosynthesis enzyme MoaA